METSAEIKDLAAALAKAQGEITGALKDSANPFFKSRYADLASCWDACRAQLSKNGLSVIQAPEFSESHVLLTTTLAHSSGQWMRATASATPKDDSPQALGSCLTYLRRYALAAFIGIAQIDDDGEAAQGRRSDAKGDLGMHVDPKVAAGIADEFRAAFDLDVDEAEKTEAVWKVHERIASDAETYVAVGDQLSAKERAAIKAYVAQHKNGAKNAYVNARGR